MKNNATKTLEIFEELLEQALDARDIFFACLADEEAESLEYTITDDSLGRETTFLVNAISINADEINVTLACAFDANNFLIAKTLRNETQVKVAITDIFERMLNEIFDTYEDVLDLSNEFEREVSQVEID